MRSSITIAAAWVALLASGSVAQQPRTGTLIVAHGADDEWNARVHEIAAAVRTGGPVAVGFLMGPRAAEHRFQDAVRDLVGRGAERVVVVPLLASSHSGHYEQIRYLSGETNELSEQMLHHLHQAGITRPAATVPLALTRALDASMELADVLADHALRLAARPPAQALFLVGHGPTSAEEHAEWMANLRPVADSVARITRFRDVKLGLLRDDAPPPVRAEAVRGIREIIALQHELTGQPVVVVPILIAKGYISTHKLPKDLAGLPLAYDGEGLLPHPAIARWVERQVSRSSATSTRSPDAR